MATTSTTTIITTTTPSDYRPGEALIGRMTAQEWLTWFEPSMVQVMNDTGLADQVVADVTELGQEVAARLNLPHSPSGIYPPVVWELVAARNYS
jgi:hypothetical protein